MDFINLTPHQISIVRDDESVLIVPPSGTVCRVTTTRTPVDTIDGVVIYRTAFGKIDYIPPKIDGTMYIVSALVKAALPSRYDIVSPGDLVRDDGGNVIGCKGLTL